jgi:hypothetical protein
LYVNDVRRAAFLGDPSWLPTHGNEAFSHHKIPITPITRSIKSPRRREIFPFSASFVLVKQRKLNFQFPEREAQILLRIPRVIFVAWGECGAGPSFCEVTQHEITSALTCFFCALSETKEMYYDIVCVFFVESLFRWGTKSNYCAKHRATLG